MVKQCVICGKEFKCSPSDKIVTCSPECRSERARRALIARGNIFSTPEILKKIKENPKKKAHAREIQDLGKKAAMELPGGQKGIQNRTSKLWILIDPSGNKHAAINLVQFIRDNAEAFGITSDDERSIHNIQSGFRAVLRTVAGRNKGRPVYHCREWGLDCPSIDFPEKYSNYEAQEILNLWISGLDIEEISQKTQSEKAFVTDVLAAANFINPLKKINDNQRKFVGDGKCQ